MEEGTGSGEKGPGQLGRDNLKLFGNYYYWKFVCLFVFLFVFFFVFFMWYVRYCFGRLFPLFWGFFSLRLSESLSVCLSLSLSLSLWYVIMMCSSFYLNVCQVDWCHMRPTSGSWPVGPVKPYGPMERANHGNFIRNQPSVTLWWDLHGWFIHIYGYSWPHGHKIPKVFRKVHIRAPITDPWGWRTDFGTHVRSVLRDWTGPGGGLYEAYESPHDPVAVDMDIVKNTRHTYGARTTVYGLRLAQKS